MAAVVSSVIVYNVAPISNMNAGEQAGERVQCCLFFEERSPLNLFRRDCGAFPVMHLGAR